MLELKTMVVVPHHDDEMIFLWSVLGQAESVVWLVDGGYHRCMESRTAFAERWPEVQLGLCRMQEPLPVEPSWEGEICQLDEAVLGTVLKGLVEDARARGVRQIVVPGGGGQYPHAHHLQLARWLDRCLGEGEERVVSLGQQEGQRKWDAVWRVYASVREGWLLDPGGIVMQVLRGGEDWIRVYRLGGPEV